MAKVDEKKVEAEQAKAVKDATIYHTDSGYAVSRNDDGILTTSERHTEGLDGLLEKVKELKKSGYTVYLEDKQID